jgi:hypothetical protein
MSPRSSAHQRSVWACPLSAIWVFSLGPFFAVSESLNRKFQN